MRLLLDECTPRRLRRDFGIHEVSTIEQAGMKGLKNGALLRTAAGRFDVLITVDKSIPDQQNLSTLNLSVLILRARTNKYLDLKRLVPQALAALDQIRPGEVIVIRA
jgi:predicted nuclease of predicted toxin-antitoxin system